MDKRTFKNKVYSELAGVVKAMSNPHRLEILELLAQGEYSVEGIADQTDLEIANASQHLQVLKRAQLVETRKEGTFVYYYLADQSVYKAWKSLRDLGMERIAEVERIVQSFRESKQGVESVSSKELAKRMQNKDVIVIDVRPEQEYKAGHIAGALNLPVEELKKELKNLSLDSEIVAYCRGPFCVFADEAVQMLAREGFTARRLHDGYPDWLLDGLPVE
ncbi:MAG: metalloregulator ArsR/SmtB family transcription factor [Balneolaceae bacterium]